MSLRDLDSSPELVSKADQNYLNLHGAVGQSDSSPGFGDRIVTASLVFCTLLSIGWLFWFRNFGWGREYLEKL